MSFDGKTVLITGAAGNLGRAVAQAFAEQGARLVLISGPSSAGKTTFSKRLAIQLLANGLHPFPLALDDYFVDRDLTPRDANGQLDYETIGALDVKLFNEHLLALMAGQPVTLPHYNFVTGGRETGPTITLGANDVLIVEGIHGLNPDLVPGLPPESIYRVYVSALTQLNLDRHNRVSTTDTRLIRRIVRDAATRGYTAAQSTEFYLLFAPRTITREPGRSQKKTCLPSFVTATATFLQPPLSWAWPTRPANSPCALKRLMTPSDSAV